MENKLYTVGAFDFLNNDNERALSREKEIIEKYLPKANLDLTGNYSHK